MGGRTVNRLPFDAVAAKEAAALAERRACYRTLSRLSAESVRGLAGG